MKAKFTVLSLLAFFCIIHTTHADVKNFGGSGRTNAVSFTIANDVYIGLGYNASGTLKDFWKYSPADDAWVSIADFEGDARMGAVAFVLNGKAYVGLGRSGYLDVPLNDFYEYNPVLDQWTECAEFGGTARYDAVSFVIENTAYVGTGCTGSEWTKDFWSFDGTSWSQLSSVFTSDKRQGAAAFVINNKAYVTGGFSDDSYFLQLDDMQEYDPSTDKWTEKIFADGINLSTYGAAAFAYDGKGYICYGSKAFVATYNPVNNQVENIGDKFSFGTDRSGAVSFVLNGVPYVGLGASGLSTTTYHNNFVPLFEPVTVSGIIKKEDGSTLDNYNLYPGVTTGTDGAYCFVTGVNEISIGDTLELLTPYGYEFYPKRIIMDESRTVNITAYKGIVAENTYNVGETIVWDADTVNVFTDVLLDSVHLIIEPGTKVKFHNWCALKLSGNGTINAQGSVGAPITFTPADTSGFNTDEKDNTGAWHGIRFKGMTAETYSIFKHCKMSHAKGCVINNQQGEPEFGGAIVVHYFENSTVKLDLINCDISNNCSSGGNSSGGGLFLGDCDAFIVNCNISNNTVNSANGKGAGIYAYTSPITILNSNVVDNKIINGAECCSSGSGIWFGCGGCGMLMYNCIVQGNTWNGELKQSSLSTGFGGVFNSNIQNLDTSEFGFINCINEDPLFKNAAQQDYSLTENSPCRNAGLIVEDKVGYGDVDILNNPRIMGEGIDIGAYEYYEPTAKFYAEIIELSRQPKLQFNSVFVGNNIESWSWDFGDGNHSDEENPIHTYNCLDKFDVELKATIDGNEYTYLRKGYLFDLLPIYKPENYWEEHTIVKADIGLFYDYGGKEENNGWSRRDTITFYPATESDALEFVFKELDLKSNGTLYVFDGINTEAPLLKTYKENSSLETVSATNAYGALTFVFTSSQYTLQGKGWEAVFYNVQNSNSQKTQHVSDKFVLYPNPITDGILNIKLPESLKGQNFNSKIFDTTGRILLSEDVKSEDNKITLHVNKLPKGVYVLKLNSQNDFYGSKLFEIQ